MTRRRFLHQTAIYTGCGHVLTNTCMAAATDSASIATVAPASNGRRFIDTELGRTWMAQWERNILADAKNRYCDRELGEELGWLVSPFLNGFHQGYLATGDSEWIARLVDWTDACVRRAIRDPDGFRGWPKGNGGGGESDEYDADSLLGEAMLLRPVVLATALILRSSDLKARFGDKARGYLELADEIFRKWEARAAWREVKDGGIWVVPAFGIDKKKGGWSAGHTARATTGFSNPDNKANHIARWHLAMADVTGKALYRERAEMWFRLMKSRLRTRADGKYLVWNYWEPAGPWDFKSDGSPKHWIGVHPNGGYYQIDAEAMVDAFEHHVVFSKEDLNRLIATNRDFMWNQQVEGAKFQRIDGGEVDARWKNSPGMLWTALIPHDETLRKVFIANHRPASWGGLAATPWFLALDRKP